MQFKNIGKKIKYAMLDSEITQKELAAKLKLKQAQISKWITGNRKPKLDNLEKLANALKKSVTYFLDDSPSQYVGNKSKNVSQVINSNVDLLKEIELLKQKNEILTLKLKLKEKEGGKKTR